jgi:hypothetical protein
MRGGPITLQNIVMQCGTLKNSATGIWERVGSAWQVSTIAYSLKRLASDGMQATEGAVKAGTLRLPLRLGYVGHEGSCQNLTQFTHVSAGMRDTVVQVLHFYT